VAPPPPVLRVAVAGGGTGGHVTPALAVADEIRRRNRDSKVLFIGTRRGIESRLVPEAGFDIEYVELSGFAGRGIFARIMALVQFVRGYFAVRDLLRRFEPELVLGTGGYVSGPAVLAGRMMKVRTIIQEQNSIPGKMNRILARFVDEVHIAFTETRMHFKETEKLRLSGNPTRIRAPKLGREALARKFGLDPGRDTVLVVGGSRGARSLNAAMADLFPRVAARRDLQFIVQTGEADHARVEAAAKAAGVLAVVRPFIAPIEEAYALATVIVCRAGAMTLAEIAQFGLPALLVPYPHAIYEHQLKNARSLEEKGAAEVLLDRDLSGETLDSRLTALLADRERRRTMSRHVWRMARPDAARRLVQAIENLTHPVARRRPANLVDEDEAAVAGRS
jgi:UDP-N-acetylglucosamine--N-acetylmuramyl-(pentapeptide) pyrophosphoryl-undecaprenol N-acetylglucosamine transferase